MAQGSHGSGEPQDLFSWAASQQQRSRAKSRPRPVIRLERSSYRRSKGRRKGELADLMLMSDPSKVERRAPLREERIRRNRVVLVLVVLAALTYTIWSLAL